MQQGFAPQMFSAEGTQLSSLLQALSNGTRRSLYFSVCPSQFWQPNYPMLTYRAIFSAIAYTAA